MVFILEESRSFQKQGPTFPFTHCIFPPLVVMGVEYCCKKKKLNQLALLNASLCSRPGAILSLHCCGFDPIPSYPGAPHGFTAPILKRRCSSAWMEQILRLVVDRLWCWGTTTLPNEQNSPLGLYSVGNTWPLKENI